MPGGLSSLAEKVGRMFSFDPERQKAFLPGEVDFFPQEGKVGVWGGGVRACMVCHFLFSLLTMTEADRFCSSTAVFQASLLL